MSETHPKDRAPAPDLREYPRNYFRFGVEWLAALRDPTPDARGGAALVPLPALKSRLDAEPLLPVKALVFHCSRCGSTLLARLLALDPGNRVFAEPDALPKFLLAHSTALQRGEKIDELRTFIRSFGLQPRMGEERLILKLTSLSVAYLPAFRAAFPQADFIYLLREPAEVIASLAANPPPFLRPENRGALAATLGPNPTDHAQPSEIEWFACYLNQNLRLAWRQRHEFSEIIDYTEHTTRYLALANRFKRPTTAALDAGGAASVFLHHSKKTARKFVPSASHDISPVLRDTAARIAGEVYRLWQDQQKRRS